MCEMFLMDSHRLYRILASWGPGCGPCLTLRLHLLSSACPTWLCTTHPGSGWHKVLWAEALNRPRGLRPTLDTSCDPPLCPDRLRLVVQASADVLHLPGKVLTVPLCLHCPRCCVLQQHLHNLIPLTAAHVGFPPLM